MLYSQVIWLGDLNYRIALSYEETRVVLEDNDWDALLRRDQVLSISISLSDNENFPYGLFFSSEILIEGPTSSYGWSLIRVYHLAVGDYPDQWLISSDLIFD